MEKSQLPLTAWFAAIEQVLANPNIKPFDLADQIQVKRLGTVRKMMERIQNAMEDDATADLLAGLKGNQDGLDGRGATPRS
jgi:hypothetical protein